LNDLQKSLIVSILSLGSDFLSHLVPGSIDSFFFGILSIILFSLSTMLCVFWFVIRLVSLIQGFRFPPKRR
jgi:phosphoglycerol transferase MdoB-like AlkP superfamily enzyme